MADAVLMMVIAATGGAVATLVRAVALARARRRLQPVDVRMTCPVTGNDVDATLLLDERTGAFRSVASCSRFTPGLDETSEGAEAPPPRSERAMRCEQRCVELLNLGIPLRPSSAPPPMDDDDEGGG
jgi:hypothetical protein